MFQTIDQLFETHSTTSGLYKLHKKEITLFFLTKKGAINSSFFC